MKRLQEQTTIEKLTLAFNFQIKPCSFDISSLFVLYSTFFKIQIHFLESINIGTYRVQ